MRDMNDAERVLLESMVDRCGVDGVLMALSEVCGAKAEHIAHAWQDASLAKHWARVEGMIGTLVPDVRGL